MDNICACVRAFDRDVEKLHVRKLVSVFNLFEIAFSMLTVAGKLEKKKAARIQINRFAAGLDLCDRMLQARA